MEGQRVPAGVLAVPDLARVGEIVTKAHAIMATLRLAIEPDLTPGEIRVALQAVRLASSKAIHLAGRLLAYQGTIRAELALEGRRIEREQERRSATRDGMLGTNNERERQARLKLAVAANLDRLADLEASGALLDAALKRANGVRDDLREGFETLSRMLAALDLEFRVESGRTGV